MNALSTDSLIVVMFLARGMERGLVLRMLSLNILGVLAAAK